MAITEAEPGLLDWRKARRSIGNGDCVEVAPASSGVFVRDSKNPGAAILGYPATAWRSFLLSAQQGRFDVPRPLSP